MSNFSVKRVSDAHFIINHRDYYTTNKKPHWFEQNLNKIENLKNEQTRKIEKIELNLRSLKQKLAAVSTLSKECEKQEWLKAPAHELYNTSNPAKSIQVSPEQALTLLATGEWSTECALVTTINP